MTEEVRVIHPPQWLVSMGTVPHQEFCASWALNGGFSYMSADGRQSTLLCALAPSSLMTMAISYVNLLSKERVAGKRK